MRGIERNTVLYNTKRRSRLEAGDISVLRWA
jgi:hypothetical protein